MYGDSYSINMDLNQHFSRYEDPLWDEGEEEAKNSVIQIKRVDLEDKCVFNIIKNNKTFCTIDCSKLTKRQGKFLKTVEGMLFMLDSFKSGVKNISGLKRVMGEEHVKAKMRKG